MSTPTAIRATFSQYAMVKTRGVLVLHMEVPLEKQAEVFAVLGYPLPGEEVWCGIARLVPPDQQRGVRRAENGTGAQKTAPAREDDPPTRITPSERGKARYASASDMERARTRAALLPKDPRFQQWVIDRNWVADDLLSNEDAAAFYIRECACAGESRRLIAEDETCYRAFIAMETQYLIDTNQMAEPR
jgi:hypothetical protein